jgi:hypothetical protein
MKCRLPLWGLKPEFRSGVANLYLNHEWTPMDTNRGWNLLFRRLPDENLSEFVCIGVHSWLNFGFRVKFW